MTNTTKEKVINILIHIFGGVELASLKAFFLNIVNRNVDIVIFTTRRSHLLYCMFMRFVISKDELVLNKKQYITDKAICFNKEKIRNSKVLVVDDILVHGRALSCVVKKVADNKPESIEQYVFVKSKNVTTAFYCDTVKIYNIESHKGEMDDFEWKRLSNQIVVALILSSTPYASYVFSFNKYMSPSEFGKIKSELENILIPDKNLYDIYMDLSLNEYNNNSEYSKIIENNVEAYVFPVGATENGENHSYLRLYYNKLTENCIIMPFYFMSSYTEEQLKSQYLYLFEKDLLCSLDPETIYRMLTAYYSLLILTNDKIINILTPISQWESSEEYISLSYYDNFYCEIIKNIENGKVSFPSRNIIVSDIENTTKFKALDNNFNLVSPDIYFDEFIKIVNTYSVDKKRSNHSSLTTFLHMFLENVNEKEEEYIFSCRDKEIIAQKQNGLSFEFVTLLSKVKESLNISMFDVLSKTLNGADTGLITISTDKYWFNGNIYYSNFLITGEQVCRLYQNEIFIFLLNIFNCFKHIDDTHTKSDVFNQFICDNLQYMSQSAETRELILNKVKDVTIHNDFIVNNIYEKVYNDELVVFLENFI